MSRRRSVHNSEDSPIFINDLDKDINSNILKFADDKLLKYSGRLGTVQIVASCKLILKNSFVGTEMANGI